MGTEEQKDSGYRGTKGHWVQRNRGRVSTEGQWVQRESGSRVTLGTEEQPV